MSSLSCRQVRAGSCALVLALLVGCGSDHPTPRRMIGPDRIAMDLPESFGATERPAVEFPHARHTAALAAEGCAPCHAADAKGRVVPRFKDAEHARDVTTAMEAYHAGCRGCHEATAARGDRKSGPVTCGECHVARRPAIATHQSMRFDYSLHARHVIAEKERCDACHHVYNKQTGKLEAANGRESSCRDCHGDHDKDRKLSLRNAAHVACIGCHQARGKAGGQTGPDSCDGCHDPIRQRAVERLDSIPRLMRGQPDRMWIQAEGATSNLVAFDHALHEPVTGSCSACHHQTLKPCRDCHTLDGGKPEGGGVTLEQAFHAKDSGRSCVGCHDNVARSEECAGCHAMLTRPPGRASCKACHNGPSPASAQGLGAASPPAEGETGEGVEAAIWPPPVETMVAEPVLRPLPEFSREDFPETVVLDRLVEQYGPSTLPHGKIVHKLDEMVRSRSLGLRFHGNGVLCAGCHHRTPLGERPPSCAACHDQTAEPLKDQPALVAAYHRQCIGCHQQLSLPTGCTDCHAERGGEEVAR